MTHNDAAGLSPVVIPNPVTTPVAIDGGSTAPHVWVDQFINIPTLKTVVLSDQVLAVLPRRGPRKN